MSMLIATLFGIALLTMGCDPSNSSANGQDSLFAKNAVTDQTDESSEDSGTELSDQEPACAALGAETEPETIGSTDLPPFHHAMAGNMDHPGPHGLGLEAPILAKTLAACKADKSCDLGTAVKEALAGQLADLTTLNQTFSNCSSDKACNIRELLAATLAKEIKSASAADISADSPLTKSWPGVSWAPPQVLWCYFDQGCDLAGLLTEVLEKKILRLTTVSADLEACLADEACPIDQVLKGKGMNPPPAPCSHRGMGMGGRGKGGSGHMMEGPGMRGDHDRGKGGNGPMMEGPAMPGGHGRGRR